MSIDSSLSDPLDEKGWLMRGRIDWERGLLLGATLRAGISYSWEGDFLGDLKISC